MALSLGYIKIAVEQKAILTLYDPLTSFDLCFLASELIPHKTNICAKFDGPNLIYCRLPGNPADGYISALSR